MKQKPEQLGIEWDVVAVANVEGMEMGVLANGTPYLSARGLARACGVAPSTIIEWVAGWSPESGKTRDKILTTILQDHGYEGDGLFIKAKGGFHAHPDDVCLAFIEYYAYHAGNNCTEKARQLYRAFAKKSLREFIYTYTGYNPAQSGAIDWQKYHDRLLMNPMPAGYFSVFGEMSEVVLRLMRQGLPMDEHTVWDISVGKAWSSHWVASKLDEKYGERTQYPHEYPSYFPQAKAGPQDIWVYPRMAVGEFKVWLDEVYLPEKLPNYLKTKAKKGVITDASLAGLLKAVEPPQMLN